MNYWKESDLISQARKMVNTNRTNCRIGALMLLLMQFICGNPGFTILGVYHVLMLQASLPYVFRTLTYVLLLFPLNIFGFSGLRVGIRKYYIENMFGDPPLSVIFMPYRDESYRNIVRVMFQRGVSIMQYSLLFLGPGMYRAYELAMVPWLLADYPYMDAQTAMVRSKEMMMDYKMRMFKLDLSYMPWYILSILTFGLSDILWGKPLREAVRAEAYEYLRQKNYRV